MAARGVLQGSLLSPVVFLVFMAPILEEMERRVKEEVGRVDVQFPSYVDDLRCRLYDRRGTGGEEVKREKMQDLVARVQRVVTEVAAEHWLPLAPIRKNRWFLEGAAEERRTGGMELPRR